VVVANKPTSWASGWRGDTEISSALQQHRTLHLPNTVTSEGHKQEFTPEKKPPINKAIVSRRSKYPQSTPAL
jgi:hypothetical protein